MKDIDFDELDRAITSVLGKNSQQASSSSVKKADESAMKPAERVSVEPPKPAPVAASSDVAATATPPQPTSVSAPVSTPAAKQTVSPAVARPDRMASSSLHARTMFGNRQRAARPVRPSTEPIVDDSSPATLPDAHSDESISRKAAEAFPLGATFAAKYDEAKRRREVIDATVEDLVAHSATDEVATPVTEHDSASPVMYDAYTVASAQIDAEPSHEAAIEHVASDLSTEVATEDVISNGATKDLAHEAEAEREVKRKDEQIVNEMEATLAAPPRRVHGRFMDVIHPSSDMRHLTGASRMAQPSQGVDQQVTDRSAQTDADKAMEQEVHAVLGRGVVIEPPQTDDATASTQNATPTDTAAMPPIDMAAVMKEELDSLKDDVSRETVTDTAAAAKEVAVTDEAISVDEPLQQPVSIAEETPSHDDVADRLVAEIEAVEAIEKEAKTDAAPVAPEAPLAVSEPSLQSQNQAKSPAARPIAVPKVASMAQRQAATQDQSATEEYPVFDAESHRLPADTTKKKTVLWVILTILVVVSLLGALGVIGWVLFTS